LETMNRAPTSVAALVAPCPTPPGRVATTRVFLSREMPRIRPLGVETCPTPPPDELRACREQHRQTNRRSKTRQNAVFFCARSWVNGLPMVLILKKSPQNFLPVDPARSHPDGAVFLSRGSPIQSVRKKKKIGRGEARSPRRALPELPSKQPGHILRRKQLSRGNKTAFRPLGSFFFFPLRAQSPCKHQKKIPPPLRSLSFLGFEAAKRAGPRPFVLSSSLCVWKKNVKARGRGNLPPRAPPPLGPFRGGFVVTPEHGPSGPSPNAFFPRQKNSTEPVACCCFFQTLPGFPRINTLGPPPVAKKKKKNFFWPGLDFFAESDNAGGAPPPHGVRADQSFFPPVPIVSFPEDKEAYPPVARPGIFFRPNDGAGAGGASAVFPQESPPGPGKKQPQRAAPVFGCVFFFWEQPAGAASLLGD